jgi:hypothetical protein
MAMGKLLDRMRLTTLRKLCGQASRAPQRRGRPVHGTDALAHLAAADQPFNAD